MIAREVRQNTRDAWRTDVNGWIRLHTEGDPFRLGFQNGYLLAAEIRDLFGRVRAYARHTWEDWGFFRETARSLYQEKLAPEYREEIDEEISEDNNGFEAHDVGGNKGVTESAGGITVSQSLGVDPSVDSLALEDYDHIDPVERIM